MAGWLWIVNSVLYCKNPEQCPSGARIHFPKQWNQAQRLSFWWAHAPIRHENGFDSTWICNHNTLTSHIQNKKYDEKSRTSRTSKVCKMLLIQLFYHWHLNMEFTLIRMSQHASLLLLFLSHNILLTRVHFDFCTEIVSNLSSIHISEKGTHCIALLDGMGGNKFARNYVFKTCQHSLCTSGKIWLNFFLINFNAIVSFF